MLRNDAVENLVRRLVFSVPRPPDEELLLELRGRFKPEVVALSEYLGRDLVREWGYERIRLGSPEYAHRCRQEGRQLIKESHACPKP